MTSTTSTSYQCPGGPCNTCTVGTLQKAYINSGFTVVYCTGVPTNNYSEIPIYFPDQEREDYVYEPICDEILRNWRKESRKKPRYKLPITHKPLLTRRMLFSKSGWLTRKGRLRKKGKK